MSFSSRTLLKRRCIRRALLGQNSFTRSVHAGLPPLVCSSSLPSWQQQRSRLPSLPYSVTGRALSSTVLQPGFCSWHMRPRRIHNDKELRQSNKGHPQPVALSKLSDNFLDGTSSVFLEELQRTWEKDPSSVDKSWDTFFRNFTGQSSPAGSTAAAASGQSIQESMNLLLLVRAYQFSGHSKANLDPLALQEQKPPVELDPAQYGFKQPDFNREFFLGVWNMSGFLSQNRPVQTLKDIVAKLEQAYCGTIGYEYMHIPDRERCNWLRERIETQAPAEFGRDRKATILDRLMWSTHFENFIAQKWTAAKRFGLEGCETLIPGMKELIDTAADRGVESIVIGMPHRGRLNVLGNVVRKPLRQIFSEFGAGIKPAEVEAGGYTGSGDVKYHLGTSYDRPTRSGKRIHLSLLANPSHLEAVSPVVIGKTRAKQYYSKDKDRKKHMAVVLHGDGSFSGQGVVYETFHLSDLPSYTTGGTIHIVVNNQVAFTTDPKYSRSSPYCTDVAKALNVPIFHVNGDDVEAVVHACELAADWRCHFHSDVVVDIVCYRRFGHNEIDEPAFTQPTMYKVIRSHKPALDLYVKKLTESGQFSKSEIDRMQDKISGTLNEEFNKSKNYILKTRDWLAAYWAGFKGPEQLSRIKNTGVKPEIMKSVGKQISNLPSSFNPHRAIKKVYEQRAHMADSGEGVDWAFGEALAFGTLLVEGNHVRLSGQDVERGTFSHRHAVLHDQKTGQKYCPLHNVLDKQEAEMFTVCNSSLSEFGVLGFELGYSMENPNSLVLWEAQFGDFANGAQVIFDQFLSSGETKWLRQSGLVVLLPHGYDGQGPEHSSARLERFLQMCDDNSLVIPEMEPAMRKQIQECNWQVVNVTTPANYFHVLRRQIHREFRKPLIVMSPKNLLRHQGCKSNISEFDDVAGHAGFDKQGTRFKRLIKDQNQHSESMPGIRRLVLCSGKIYYELDEERKRVDAKDVAICRVEQLSPFPYDLIQRELKRYSNAEVVWCQEEPMNMGGYAYVAPRVATAMSSLNREHVKYVGRAPSAATATGFGATHTKEQKELIQMALQNAEIKSSRRGIALKGSSNVQTEAKKTSKTAGSTPGDNLDGATTGSCSDKKGQPIQAGNKEGKKDWAAGGSCNTDEGKQKKRENKDQKLYWAADSSCSTKEGKQTQSAQSKGGKSADRKVEGEGTRKKMEKLMKGNGGKGSGKGSLKRHVRNSWRPMPLADTGASETPGPFGYRLGSQRKREIERHRARAMYNPTRW